MGSGSERLREADRKRAALKRAAEVASRSSKVCVHCGVDFGVDYKPKGGRPKKFCNKTCLIAHRLLASRMETRPRIVAREQERSRLRTTVRDCAVCGRPMEPGRAAKTCSRSCHSALIAAKAKGRPKIQVATERECVRCHRVFTAKQKQCIRCKPCVRAISPCRDHGKPQARAKRFGVPYTSGIKPDAVFLRDGWRCQLCGCATPKRLRGKNKPTAPEVDHIIPLSAGGGHTWDNVQCACHACNIAKSGKPMGQLRLAV
jgi:5-methylcytosine-specific restriction endonuclease McrA